MTSEAARQTLFKAIGEGRFERIPAIAAEYRESVVARLSAETPEEVLRPLKDAVRYLRTVRAHQSARFQRLSAQALYRRYFDF